VVVDMLISKPCRACSPGVNGRSVFRNGKEDVRLGFDFSVV
jgi:hypothetical protein